MSSSEERAPTRRRQSRRVRSVGLGLVALLCAACGRETESPITRAEFGIFFGGQVQERLEIPYELDSNRQTVGFVLELSHPLPVPTPLHWEVSKPAPNTRLSDPMNRRVELFDAVLAPGQRQVSKVVKFEPGDGLGTWNIRVTLGSHLAIDRPFLVYDAGSRSPNKRRPKPVRRLDAGL